MTPGISRAEDKAAGEDTAGALLAAVRELAAELHPRRPPPRRLTLDSSLERELGLDSLARVELLARIEKRFHVTLPETAFAAAETARDLLRAVLSAGAQKSELELAEIARRAPGAAEAAPHGAHTLVEVLDWHVRAHPERAHIQLRGEADKTETITYRDLSRGAAAVAAGLQRRGLLPGQTVALMLPTGREYFLSFYGIVLAGGVPVPIYPPARPTQLEDHLRRHRGIIANCLAAILITVPEARRIAQLLKSQVETLAHVVTVEELAAGAADFTAVPIGAQDIAFLQYTSGSTGNPKGVVLTHANLLANIRAMGAAVRADSTDVFVSWLPLYHDMGLIGAWLGTLYYAAQLVLMSPLAFLTRPQRWLWEIHRHRATLSAGPNFAYELCLKRIEDGDIEGLDLSSWRIAFNGAEPVSPATLERFCRRFRDYGFRCEALTPVYGLAECAVGLAFPPLARGPLVDTIERDTFTRTGAAVPARGAHALRFVSCGLPLPDHELRVVDAAGRELPERREGRLEFRGPSATSGYFRNPQETQKLFDGDWLDSGDLAYTAGGEVYITGRIKDVIIHAGRNIYPHEIEEAVGNIPGIRKGCVAVFGVADPQSGTERLTVLAETREQDGAARAALGARVNAVVADLAGAPPDDVVLAPPHAIPKTSSGKIRRAASRELLERGAIRETPRAVWWQVARLALSAAMPELRRLWRSAVALLYAVYALALFWVIGVPVWVLVLLLPRLSWRWALMRAAMRALLRAAGVHLRVHGLKHLPPRDRPGVLVANHGSYLDGLILVAALPREGSFVAKAEFLRNPIIGPFLRRAHAEFVERFDRQKGVADARGLARALRAGRSLLVFPEGTFTRIPGLRPFRMGAFIAAAETGAPLVPVAIRGARSVLRAGSWLPHRGVISVSVGAPIEPAALREAEANVWNTGLKLRDAARAYILRYCGEPDLGPENPPP
ncbi:MAG: acyl-phosphate glycerol 3-phosphate acyltransferase [Candidatus Muproteobacteria bacterium RIFCSPHIGHO2_01_FULL_65_16]|uniref:Acyl-phosphate glycerol 3-phosphate acyltransferase n=1 Tax=Candidatus Muproteobacteria bacterium RIFCSPHIGHO2_01_FULL_65_16 TaxID=1817764 RepID=A0A1F6TRE6_9PROT|nr:MAG: acyl-phosphate glycerol 3-phosphate acyltransferase [Candidatus Muproteobacteria bacterium RIFCSPHIGHO2_01_FULL_65_16]